MTTPVEPSDRFSDLAELLRDERDVSAGHGTVETKARRTRILRGLIAAAIVVVLLGAAVGGYAGWALNAPLPEPTMTSQTPSVLVPPAAAIALPSEGASAISISGADAYLGPTANGIWATSGTDDARPIASISKLITALVVLDARPLAGVDDPGPTITFDKADHDLYDEYYVLGATIAPMPTGSTMSQYDALATMLVPSASNYAEAVSTWAFGSQGAFLSAARSWLAAHGLNATTIVEPTGISPRNTSTPTDLIALGRLAAANPVITRIVSTDSVIVPGDMVLPNTNGLLGSSGITGLKTGTLGEGTYNLLYTATLGVGAEDALDVVGVVLGEFSRESADRAVLGLLGSIEAGFHRVTVAARGDDVGGFTTPWGATARMVIAEGASIFTWSDTPITVAMELTKPTTYAHGEEVGTVTWTAGPHTETAPVVIKGSIAPPTAEWRLTHPSELAE